MSPLKSRRRQRAHLAGYLAVRIRPPTHRTRVVSILPTRSVRAASAGFALVLLGIELTMVFVIARTDCQRGAGGGPIGSRRRRFQHLSLKDLVVPIPEYKIHCGRDTQGAIHSILPRAPQFRSLYYQSRRRRSSPCHPFYYAFHLIGAGWRARLSAKREDHALGNRVWTGKRASFVTGTLRRKLRTGVGPSFHHLS